MLGLFNHLAMNTCFVKKIINVVAYRFLNYPLFFLKKYVVSTIVIPPSNQYNDLISGDEEMDKIRYIWMGE